MTLTMITQDVDSVGSTIKNPVTVIKAINDITHTSNNMASDFIGFTAGHDVILTNDTHNAKLELLVADHAINIKDSNIEASIALFFNTPELHIHGGKVCAKDIYLLTSCSQDVDTGALLGNVHLVDDLNQMQKCFDEIAATL